MKFIISPDGQPRWFVAVDRWQRVTQCEVDADLVRRLEPHCAEFLVHATDVEGKQSGVDMQLVEHLARICSIPVTYAGGARSAADLGAVRAAGGGRIDLTIGSALDIFGGSGASVRELAALNAALVVDNNNNNPERAREHGLAMPYPVARDVCARLHLALSRSVPGPLGAAWVDDGDEGCETIDGAESGDGDFLNSSRVAGGGSELPVVPEREPSFVCGDALIVRVPDDDAERRGLAALRLHLCGGEEDDGSTEIFHALLSVNAQPQSGTITAQCSVIASPRDRVTPKDAARFRITYTLMYLAADGGAPPSPPSPPSPPASTASTESTTAAANKGAWRVVKAEVL
jgi:hypothetical protein